MKRLVAVLVLFWSFAGFAQAQSLTASPSTVYTGQAVNAAWAGVASPVAQDWIALYPVGAADNAFIAWRYTDGNASGSAPLLVPANTAAGSYELRLFANNGYMLLASSNSFSLQAPSGSISASPASIYSGLNVTASWSSISEPTATDWVALVPVGGADNAFVAWRYTDGNAAGSGPLTIPANTALGSYELRLYTNNGYQRLGTSNSISIQTPSGTLAASPATVYTSQSVTATWSAISSPTAGDWIALYPAGAPDSGFLAWRYTDGNAAGAAPLAIPVNTAAGTYELRLFSNNGYQRLATSDSFAIATPPAATLTVTPGSTAPGTSVTAAWTAIFAPIATDWIALYPVGAADTAFVSWRYTDGNAAGNVPFAIAANVALGSYELRLFANNGYTRLATSAVFSVGVMKLSFIHPDHLNTPREVYDDQAQLRWKWDQQEPFGVTTPNEDPSSLGAFEMPLRFPGQYDDKETGKSNNYFRDYDSAIGRYKQSDPIGLRGGVNTYGYVAGSPNRYADPLGLFLTSVDAACAQAPDLCAEVVGQIIENTSNVLEGCVTEEASRAADTIRDMAIFASVVGGIKALPDLPRKLPVPKVQDPKLANIVGDLYKGAKSPAPIGTGSTADAIRNELATGLPTHGTFHSQKGEQYITALSNWLSKNPNASSRDRLVAESLKRDLQAALGRK